MIRKDSIDLYLPSEVIEIGFTSTAQVLKQNMNSQVFEELGRWPKLSQPEAVFKYSR